MDALQENKKIIQLSLISGLGGFLFALDAGKFLIFDWLHNIMPHKHLIILINIFQIYIYIYEPHLS